MSSEVWKVFPSEDAASGYGLASVSPVPLLDIPAGGGDFSASVSVSLSEVSS